MSLLRAPWAPCPHEPQRTAHISRLTNSDAGVRVGRLHQLLALMANDPVGVDLSSALGVQVDHLEVPEVGFTDGTIFRTHVINVWDAVIVKVVLASVPTSVTCRQDKQDNEKTNRWFAICLSEASSHASWGAAWSSDPVQWLQWPGQPPGSPHSTLDRGVGAVNRNRAELAALLSDSFRNYYDLSSSSCPNL